MRYPDDAIAFKVVGPRSSVLYYHVFAIGDHVEGTGDMKRTSNEGFVDVFVTCRGISRETGEEVEQYVSVWDLKPLTRAARDVVVTAMNIDTYVSSGAV